VDTLFIIIIILYPS